MSFFFGFVVSFAAFLILVAIEPKLTQAGITSTFAERKTESLWISPSFYRFWYLGKEDHSAVAPSLCLSYTMGKQGGDMLHKRAMIVLLTLGTASGCVTAGDEDLFERVEVQALEGCDDPVDFEAELLEPINTACGGCHVATDVGGFNFSDENGVLTAASFIEHVVDQPSGQSDKPLIESGSELNSYFIDRVLQRDATIMPPGGTPLSESATEALRCWVEQGAYVEGE